MSYFTTLSQLATSPISIGSIGKAVGQWGVAELQCGSCARIQSYMSDGDWLDTSCNLLIAYWGKCM